MAKWSGSREQGGQSGRDRIEEDDRSVHRGQGRGGHAFTLDSIAAEAAKLRRQLGPSDNAILDQYLHNIRDVELTLERMEARANTVVDAAAPIGIPEAFDDHMTVTYDLMRLAFQGDISRVLTFMVGHEASSCSYAHIGISEPHHPVSHHADKPEGIEKYAKLCTYQVVKLAE